MSAARKPLHPVPPCLETAVIRAAQPARSRLLPAGQSSMNCLRSATGPVSFQGILEVLPIRPQGVCSRSDRIAQAPETRFPRRSFRRACEVAAPSPCRAGGTLPSHCRGAGPALRTPKRRDPLQCSPRICAGLPITSAPSLASQESLPRQTSLGSCSLGIVSESPRSQLYP